MTHACPYCGSNDIPHVCSAVPALAPAVVQAPEWSAPPDPGPFNDLACPRCGAGPFSLGWLFDYCHHCGEGF